VAIRNFMCCVCVVAGLFAGSAKVSAQIPDEEAIRAVREASNQALKDKDIEALEATWLPNLHVTGSNGDVISSGDEMARIFAGAFEDPGYISYERRPVEVRLSPGQGYAAESGSWTGRSRDNGGEMVVTGTYMAQWHKVAGVWRIRSEVFVALTCEGSDKCQDLP
jgi:ketosteroid isomerase-like protein